MKGLADVRPRELYNVAAISFVPASWEQPILTWELNAQRVTGIVGAVRQVDPTIRLYQLSSSEMYGKVRDVPRTELTPLYPRSPYEVVEGARALHHCQLSRELRTGSQCRHPLQPLLRFLGRQEGF